MAAAIRANGLYLAAMAAAWPPAKPSSEMLQAKHRPSKPGMASASAAADAHPRGGRRQQEDAARERRRLQPAGDERGHSSRRPIGTRHGGGGRRRDANGRGEPPAAGPSGGSRSRRGRRHAEGDGPETHEAWRDGMPSRIPTLSRLRKISAEIRALALAIREAPKNEFSRGAPGFGCGSPIRLRRMTARTPAEDLRRAKRIPRNALHFWPSPPPRWDLPAYHLPNPHEKTRQIPPPEAATAAALLASFARRSPILYGPQLTMRMPLPNSEFRRRSAPIGATPRRRRPSRSWTGGCDRNGGVQGGLARRAGSLPEG